MLKNALTRVQVVTTSMVYAIMVVSQDGQAISAIQFAQLDSLDRSVLTYVTTHAKAVTIPMVCVILGVILAGRETTVMKVLTFTKIYLHSTVFFK